MVDGTGFEVLRAFSGHRCGSPRGYGDSRDALDELAPRDFATLEIFQESSDDAFHFSSSELAEWVRLCGLNHDNRVYIHVFCCTGLLLVRQCVRTRPKWRCPGWYQGYSIGRP
jgi:hypothetical protein